MLILAASLIVFGIWFSTTNAYTLMKGYALYKYGYAETAAEELVENQIPQDEVPVSQDLPLYSVKPEVGEEIGSLKIPKLNATLPIYHGTDEDELEKGVGHYAGSVLPGEKDNSVLSGHRDTVFRDLGQVGENDLLVVKTSAGEFTYKVKRVRIVDEDDRTVIVPKPRATLTVSTCYPFNFIGSAPERYILEAVLISSK